MEAASFNFLPLHDNRKFSFMLAKMKFLLPVAA